MNVFDHNNDVNRLKELEGLSLKKMLELTDRFPFAAKLWVEAAKKAHNEKNETYNDIVTHAALTVPSRIKLKKLVILSDIQSEKPFKREIQHYQEKDADTTSAKHENRVDSVTVSEEVDALERQYRTQAYEAIMQEELAELEKVDIVSQINKKNIEEHPKQVQEASSKTNDEFETSKSFVDWLTLCQDMEIDGSQNKAKPQIPIEESTTNVEITSESKEDKPISLAAIHDKAKKSITTDEDYYTETLGIIYEKQNKFKSAIKVYKVLQLKFPEKSSYFAARIKELKDKN